MSGGHIENEKLAASVAIVIGASFGIGRATAIRLARDYDAIILVARNEAALRDVASAIREAGAEPMLLPGDLRVLSTASSIMTSALHSFGGVDAVINIAGAVPGGDLFDLSDQESGNGAALKLQGARRLTKEAWEHLKRRSGAVIFSQEPGQRVRPEGRPRLERSTRPMRHLRGIATGEMDHWTRFKIDGDKQVSLKTRPASTLNH